MWLNAATSPLTGDGPVVSCICPTYNRQNRHAQLYAIWNAQEYPYKELLILDDSVRPSPFFSRLRDPRVRYMNSPVRLSVGQKRNTLISASNGAVIAHFDDDDLYEPKYLAEMVKQLDEADLVKLSVFNIINERDGSKWRWDTRTSGGTQTLMSSKFSKLSLSVPSGWVDKDVTSWGFGFSYVYKKALWEKVKFPDISLREDYEFIKRARGVGAKLKQVSDHPDLVWHAVHSTSMSTAFPQVRLDGPTPAPVANMVVGAAFGAVVGTVIGGPLGTVVGSGAGTALTGAFLTDAMGAEAGSVQPKPFLSRIGAGWVGGFIGYLLLGPPGAVGGALAGVLITRT